LGRRPLGAVLHSSNEPGELSQWLCHDDSTINIVVLIIIMEPRSAGALANFEQLSEHSLVRNIFSRQKVITIALLTIYGHINTTEQQAVIQQYGDW